MSATIAFTNVCGLDSWARSAGLSTDEDARIKRVAAKLKEHGVDIVGANELVTYQNAEVFSKAMGWGGQRSQVIGTGPSAKIDIKKGDSCMLRGSGHAGVGMGWIWDPDVWQPYWAKEIDTYPGWDRNRYGVAQRGFLGGKRLGLGLLHLEFYPKGTNNKPYYDNIREKQVDGFLDDVQSPNQSWFIGGDENHSSNDLPDAPHNGAKGHGLVKVDTGNIIRAHKTKDIQSSKPYMVNLGTATDHPALIIPGVVVPR